MTTHSLGCSRTKRNCFQAYTEDGSNRIRYADDIVLLAKSQRATERLLRTSTEYLKGKLKLKVNAEKRKAVSVVAIRNFKFLGFAMGRNKNGYFIRVNAKSLKKAKWKLKELTSSSQGRNVRLIMHNFKMYMTGWLAGESGCISGSNG